MERDLIDGYVEALRGRLAWRPDAGDVADEVEDHLREHAARLVRQGETDPAAQRRTLERFGDLDLVAQAFAVNGSGVPAVPTRVTRRAGTVGLLAAGGWVLAAVTGAAGGHTGVLVPWTTGRYAVFVTALTATFALTTLTVLGVLLRTGRHRTASGRGVLGVGVLLALATYPFGWAPTVLGGLLAVAVLSAFAGRRAETVRMRPVLLLTVWLPGTLGLYVFDDLVPLGPVDEYGDHPVVWLLAFTMCALCSALAVGLVGARLRAERPADVAGSDGLPLRPASV